MAATAFLTSKSCLFSSTTCPVNGWCTSPERSRRTRSDRPFRGLKNGFKTSGFLAVSRQVSQETRQSSPAGWTGLHNEKTENVFRFFGRTWWPSGSTGIRVQHVGLAHAPEKTEALPFFLATCKPPDNGWSTWSERPRNKCRECGYLGRTPPTCPELVEGHGGLTKAAAPIENRWPQERRKKATDRGLRRKGAERADARAQGAPAARREQKCFLCDPALRGSGRSPAQNRV